MSISKTNELELCKSKAMNIDDYQKIASLTTCLLLFSDWKIFKFGGGLELIYIQA